MKFSEIGLSASLLSTISEVGYDTPTPIQQKAIPSILAGSDIIGIAQTGTGKTAAFTWPVIEKLSSKSGRARMARALILSPTRELAQQTAENFKTYGKNHKLTHALLIGGASIAQQAKILTKGADVLIATPGRLLDHADRGRLLLNAIEIFIVDEGDRMLDMGFIPSIQKIIKLLPLKKQTLLFSATMPSAIEKLAQKFMRDPVRVTVSQNIGEVASTIKQVLVWADEKDKADLLVNHLNKVDGTTIIFCNRKRDVDKVYKFLKTKKFEAKGLHGDMSQFQRNKVLDKFRNNNLPILVASNVAARGLDIANISYVINFDVPQQAEDYIHRIGRTGRAGRAGDAWTFATKKEVDFVNAIEVLTGYSIPLLEGNKVNYSNSKKPNGKRSNGKKNMGSRSNKDPSRNRNSNRHKRSQNPKKPNNLPSFISP